MRKFLILSLLSLITVLSRADNEVTSPKVLSSQTGRYVFGQASLNFSDKYMLDTKEGNLWALVKDQNNPITLVPIFFLCGENKYSDRPTCENPKTIR